MRALRSEDEQIELVQLLTRARNGDPEAFVEFYDRYWELVVAYFRRRVERPDVAVDLAAEVFAVALQLVGDLRKPIPASPAAWLFSVAHNKYVDAVRRGSAETRARKALEMERVVLDDADLERVDKLTDEHQVLQLLDRLPDDQRQAVWLRVINEQPYAEVAARLGCSDLVARQRVSRALRTLRTALRSSR